MDPIDRKEGGARNTTLFGNALEVLSKVPSNTVHCVVTSPPYWDQRDYQVPDSEWPDGWVGSLGNEPSSVMFLDHLLSIFREVKRVLHPTGTLWVNIGDTYVNKSLEGVPWRLALRLKEDGWILRSEVIWNKTSRFPENVKDRPTQTFEPLFMLTKSQQYYYDEVESREWGKGANLRNVWDMSSKYKGEHDAVFPELLPKLCISLSTSRHGACPTCKSPYQRVLRRQTSSIDREGHPTRYGDSGSRGAKAYNMPSLEPPTLITDGWAATCSCGVEGVEPCLVLDPFSGSGTTISEALSLDRDYLGIDINPNTEKESKSRVEGVDRLLPFI